MDTIERIRSLCKQHGLAVSRLEKDLGFSNGYISAMREGTMRADRLQKVADYFGVTVV